MSIPAVVQSKTCVCDHSLAEVIGLCLVSVVSCQVQDSATD